MNPILIALIAGLVSALFYNAFAYAGAFGLVLIYLSPFPIIIAGLALRWVMGFAAAVVAALLIAIMTGAPVAGISYFVSVGLPAGILGYLALLARSDEKGGLEWFPIGDLVSVSAALSIAVVVFGAYTQGGFQAMDQATGAIFDQIAQMDNSPLAEREGMSPEEMRSMFVWLLPIVGGISLFLSYLASLYVAGRILRSRNTLLRPWPVISELTLPFWTALATAGFVLLSMSSGEAGRIGELGFGVFLMALAVQGLALIHSITIGNPMRFGLLFGLYGLLIIIPLIPVYVIVLAFVGIFSLATRSKPNTPGTT